MAPFAIRRIQGTPSSAIGDRWCHPFRRTDRKSEEAGDTPARFAKPQPFDRALSSSSFSSGIWALLMEMMRQPWALLAPLEGGGARRLQTSEDVTPLTLIRSPRG